MVSALILKGKGNSRFYYHADYFNETTAPAGCHLYYLLPKNLEDKEEPMVYDKYGTFRVG